MFDHGILLVFWYGMIHALGPDHLSAIADFSIGRDTRRTFAVTALFAVGHGAMLYVFARLIQSTEIARLSAYGDLLSSSILLAIGAYLLYLVSTDRIQLRRHLHDGKEHVHIWLGRSHSHQRRAGSGALAMGSLMGIGGLRGMLVTLGAVQSARIDLSLVLAFIAGVMLVFTAFGLAILFVNRRLLHERRNVRRVFAAAGLFSILAGGRMLV